MKALGGSGGMVLWKNFENVPAVMTILALFD